MKIKKMLLGILTVIIAGNILGGMKEITIKSYDANGTQSLMTQDVFGGSFGDVKRDVTMFGDSGCNTYLVNTTVNPAKTDSYVQGIDFLFLVDTSGSMGSYDGTTETRSQRVTNGINAFIDDAVTTNKDKTQSDIRVAINAYDSVYQNYTVTKTGTVPSGTRGRTEGYHYDKTYLKKVTATHTPNGGTMLGLGLSGATSVVAKLNDSYYKNASGNYPVYGDPITTGREENRIKVLVIFTDGDMSNGAQGTYAEEMRKELARGYQNNYDNIFICNSDVNTTNNQYGATIMGAKSSPLGDLSNALITSAFVGSRANSLVTNGIVEAPKQDHTSQVSFQRNYFEVSLNNGDKYVASNATTSPGKVGYGHLKDAFAGIAKSVASTMTISDPLSLVEKLSPFFNPYGGATAYVIQNGNKIPIPGSITRYDSQNHSMITDLELDKLATPIDSTKDKIVVEYKIKANSKLVSGGGINLFSATFFNTAVAPKDQPTTHRPYGGVSNPEFNNKYQYPEFINNEPVQNSNTFMVVPDPMKVTLSRDKVEVDTYGKEIKLSEAYGLIDSNGNIIGIQGGEGNYVVEWKYWDEGKNSYISIPGGIDAKFTVNKKTNFFVQVNCRIGCEFTSAVAVARVNTKITVNHYKEGTTNILAPTETKKAIVGDVYVTKPATIIGYEPVLPMPFNSSGTAIDSDIVVNYYYKAREVKANVKYLELGTDKELSQELVETRKFGESFDYKPLDINGYTYSNVSGTTNGTFGEKDVNIIFYYKSNAPKEYSLKVKYVNQSGNEILPSVTTKHPEGYSYSIDAINIPGYIYDSFIISNQLVNSTNTIQTGVAKGILDKDTIVTLVYKEDNTSKGVIVKHVDESGKEIASSIIIKGNVGDTYTTGAVGIEGYKLKVTPQNANGVITDTLTVVTYVYEKLIQKGSVNVKYIDKETGKVLESFILTGNVGDTYTTEQKTFEGYKFSLVTGSRIGLFKVNIQEVIYSYESVKVGEIKVIGVDQNGNVLAESKIEAIIGKTYATEPLVIEGYTLIKVPENFAGIFDGEETVTYVYKANEKTEGKLIVTAIDENGKILYTEEKDLPIGYDYEIKPANLTGYTYISADKELKGKIVNGETRITLKYKQTKPVTENNQNNTRNTSSESITNKLPQTGGVFNISLIMILGINIVLAGIFLRKKMTKDNEI